MCGAQHTHSQVQPGAGAAGAMGKDGERGVVKDGGKGGFAVGVKHEE